MNKQTVKKCEEKIIGKDKIIARCGMIVKRSDGFVCPYFCRKSDWDKKHKGFGPCGVDIQVGTNVCLYAFDCDL